VAVFYIPPENIGALPSDQELTDPVLSDPNLILAGLGGNVSRRGLLKVFGGAGAAGALSKLPVEKALKAPIEKAPIEKAPIDFSDLISSVKNDLTGENADIFKLKNYFSSPEDLFDWFDSGITENLLMEDAKTFLEQTGGDVKRANDEIMENIEGMIESLYYDDDFVPEEFFEENITNPLIDDLTKTSD